ncbi:MAG: hypothetical protein HY617_01390 [Candidatus Sungbacteria bacterium]|nr:hypothetical protein [Candidatus Sungbacteria bacterium]
MTRFLLFPLHLRGVTVRITVRQGFWQDFRELTKKYGVKAELRKDWHPPVHRFTLFRVIEREGDRELPLPPGFVAEVEETVLYYFLASTKRILGHPPVFLVSLGKTMEEIKQAQKDWHDYCVNFHAGD